MELLGACLRDLSSRLLVRCCGFCLQKCSRPCSRTAPAEGGSIDREKGNGDWPRRNEGRERERDREGLMAGNWPYLCTAAHIIDTERGENWDLEGWFGFSPSRSLSIRNCLIWRFLVSTRDLFISLFLLPSHTHAYILYNYILMILHCHIMLCYNVKSKCLLIPKWSLW